MKLTVNEIFYSLQGEGRRTGEASIFIRLAGCNLKCPFCDTDFSAGKVMTVYEILEKISGYPCTWIVWTGGEPALQLTGNCLQFFKNAGYRQAIETNGTLPLPAPLDYIACSPKERYETIREHIPAVNEIRLPVQKGDNLPDISILPYADSYLVSPVFDGNAMNRENIDYCVSLVRRNPQWSLSLQTHKLIHIA
jgi:organic radical activating enzyme